ncbi:hypothetical protein M0765_012765 [Variovorax sp. S2]|uniref:hypothetical protein n=1 Tax=Variovorax sp. S12S4 TaxID=3029170 RepID=UPI00215CE172|nr:hypothetical protein [Variovorax sp. S12S4]MCR8958565.1 hypothetical protein [Variovorax sp. S12S4]
MAESEAALGRSSAPFTAPEPTSSSLDDFALQACDDAQALNHVVRAYTALEKLIDTSALSDCEVLTPSRTELSALLRLLNDALLVRINTVNAATGVVHEALQRNTTGAM